MSPPAPQSSLNNPWPDEEERRRNGQNVGHSEGGENKLLLNLFLEQPHFFKKISDSCTLHIAPGKQLLQPQSANTQTFYRVHVPYIQQVCWQEASLITSPSEEEKIGVRAI